MMDRLLLPADLRLFDGASGGASGGEGGASGGETGQTDGGAVRSGRQEAEQDAPETGAAGSESGEKTGEAREAERRRAFRELVQGEYKDLYDQELQRLTGRRDQEVRGLEQQLESSRPILDMLLDRYKIGDGDLAKLAKAVENDDAYWSQAAEEAGLSVEQYKQFQRLQRQNEALLRQQRQRLGEERANAQLQKWYGEAEEVKAAYPSFDLSREVQDPQFLSMLRSGVPVRQAYEVRHMEEIKAGIAAMQAKATERQVADNIRARGARPAENGTAGQSAFTVKDDVHKLTKKDREEIVRRAARGERIVF